MTPIQPAGGGQAPPASPPAAPGAVSPVAPTVQAEPGTKGRTLVDAVNESSVGFVGNAQEMIGRSIGQVAPGVVNRQAIRDRQVIRRLRQEIISSFTTSGRIPLQEQERILAFVPDTGFFESVPVAQESVLNLNDALRSVRDSEARIASDPTAGSRNIASAKRSVRELDRILQEIGDVSKIKQKSATSGLEHLSDEELKRMLQEGR